MQDKISQVPQSKEYFCWPTYKSSITGDTRLQNSNWMHFCLTEQKPHSKRCATYAFSLVETEWMLAEAYADDLWLLLDNIMEIITKCGFCTSCETLLMDMLRHFDQACQDHEEVSAVRLLKSATSKSSRHSRSRIFFRISSFMLQKSATSCFIATSSMEENDLQWRSAMLLISVCP